MRLADGTETLSDQASFVYDDFGRRLEQTDALGHATRWVYDSHGQAIRRESPNGHSVEWEYDHSRGGLLTRQTAKLNDTDPAPHETRYAYDALGQLTRVEAPEISYQYTYDSARRLATVTDSRGGKTLSYRHSPGGLLDSLVDSDGGRQDYLYDAVGRLSALQTAGGERIDFVYDAGGRLLETAMANGYSSLYRYNAGGDLAEIRNRAAGADVSRHVYGYDSLGRRDSHQEVIAGTTTDYRYQYDNLDRLQAVRTQGGATLFEAYAYDAYGNRRQRTAQDSSVRRYLYDAAQQLKQIRSGSDTGTLLASYAYDDAGNQTQRTGGANLTLAYDALERLASVSGSAAESYRYDHQGRRIETASGGNAKRLVYAGQDLWSEYGTDWNAAPARYAYAGLDRPLLRTTASGNTYYHADALGSIVATSNAAGAITGSARYDAFGQTLAQTGTIPRFGYAGREPDQSGLIHYRARAYDPSLGRFAQRDPAGFADGINPYAYVGNNPISFNDPLGLSKAMPSIGGASAFAGMSNIASKIGWGTAAQFGLDVVATSEIPVVSQAAGVIAAGVYASQGDKFGTATSLAGLMPIAGITADAARMGRWADNAVSATKELPAALRGGEANVHVYQGVKNGEAVYVGITNNLVARQAAHGERFVLDPLTTSGVTRGEARAIEQASIVENPGFQNIRNSISPNHSYYQDAVDWGKQWLRSNGY